MPPETVLLLAGSLQRLDERIRRWSNARWAARTGSGRTSAEVAYELALLLAEAGRRAGNGAPDALPGRVAAHAIADQLVVLGRELTGAPDASAVAEAALQGVERAGREL